MLILTLLVRDEEDILEANLEFHLDSGVDHVLVTDHRSTDATPAILERYAGSGRLTTFREEEPAYHQSVWVTRMARRAYEMGATWVINGDADEFWLTDRADLASALATVPGEYDVVVAQRRDFPPPADELGPFWQRMTVREVSSTNLLGLPLPPKVAHRARPDIVVAQGNHSVAADGLGGVLDDGRLEILHFPLRSFDQFQRKISNGGAAYEAPAAPPHVGGTWRHAYRLLLEGRLRELYETRLIDEQRLQRELRDGALVEDTRLRDRLGGSLPATSDAADHAGTRSG